MSFEGVLEMVRFFLGGVPFGCDNIGDEAILASIVSILRRNFNGCEISVSTGAPEKTASLLGVNTFPLYGFKKEYPLSDLSKALQGHDVFIWSGATGLSDYPALAIQILDCAQKNGLKTVVWGVGMDSTFNPVFFKLTGKKRILCNLLSKTSFCTVDFAALVESALVRNIRKTTARTLSHCDLIVCRDPESQKSILSCSDKLSVIVGADSALLFNQVRPDSLNSLPFNIKSDLLGNYEKIGVCISSQRTISDLDSLVRTLDAMLASPQRRMFFIPMNPQTDYELMEGLRKRMANKSKAYLLTHCEKPEQVLTIASHCSVVLSSRLHLLILSANVGTPIVGISRGSKIDNFLGQFNLKSAGNVYDCDFDLLQSQVESLIKDSTEYQQKRTEVYQALHQRLSYAESLLVKTCSNVSH